MGSVSLSREAIEAASSTLIPIDYKWCHITFNMNSRSFRETIDGST